jgi:TRAP-type C4-dicarboxylate transport system permease small subunit
MTVLLDQLARVHGLLVKLLEKFLVFAFILLTLDVLWGVFSRYVLGAQSPWTEELAIYLLVWVSLLGASVTYGEKGHLGVDYFVGKFDPAAQKVAAIAVEVLVLIFGGFALCYGGYELVVRTLESDQVSPSLGVPVGYLYLAAPISGVFFVMFSIESLLELLTGRASGRNSALDVHV